MTQPSRQSFWRGGYYLLAGWTLLNLLQAGLTELDPDEAYYWMYARHLDWGYFDHPPAIALLIHWGGMLAPNELGVRLGVVLLQSAGFLLWWDLAGRPADRPSLWTFAALLAAMPLLQIFGFIATPDSPLLFFTLFFFWSYRRFMDQPGRLSTLALGLAMAALLYSKYHGLLVIGFTFLSNWRLIRRPAFYLASIIGLLLFLPHLYWQYAQDFPSFRYHLVGRDDPYELKHTFTYLLNQVVIFNPLLFPMLLAALWRSDWRVSPLRRAFYVNITGFWIFFFLTTFKGHAEPQWTAVLTIPLVLIAFEYARQNPGYGRWVRRIGLFSFLLFLGARLTLVVPALAFNFNKEFHRKTWTFDLRQEAGGAPVVFQDSYRDASKYAFYTGEPAYTFTDKDYRRNQFDIWDFEKDLHNRRVLLAAHKGWKCRDCELIELTRKAYKFKWADSLQITQKVRIATPAGPFNWTVGKKELMTVTLSNPYEHAIEPAVGNMPIRIVGLLYNGGEKEAALLPAEPSPAWRKTAARSAGTLRLQVFVPDTLRGEYQLIWGLQTGDLPPALSSSAVLLNIQ